jgi:hypothetical protein
MSDSLPPDGPEAAAAVDGGATGGGGMRSMVERWKMDGAPARARLLLRAVGSVFSLIALVVMASNTHGDGGSKDFNNYPEYK